MSRMRTRIGAVLIAPALVAATFRLLHAQAQPARETHTPNAIVGRVTNAAGQPMADAGVTLVTRQGSDRHFGPATANLIVRTDDKGQYRFDNARLGDYLVVVFPQNVRLGADGKPNRIGYATTYHPSAKSAAEAVAVAVTTLGPVTADITLLPAPLAIVTGQVFDHDDRPAGGRTLLIAHGDNLFGVDARAVQLRGDGTFALAAVPPGTYFLQMREGQWPPPRDVETPLISGATVVVDGKDVVGVKVRPIHMAHASGHLVIDPAVRATLDPSSIRVSAVPLNFEGNPGPEHPGTVRGDLTFDFRTWPGPHAVRVSTGSQAWTVKAIRYKAADVTASGIDFKDGEEVAGIEIELVGR